MLRVDVERSGAHARLLAGGSLDIATAPELREALRAIIGDEQRVVVDLEAVDFVDSSALGVLVGALRRAREHGGDLRVECTNREVVRVFRVSGLMRTFGIEELDEPVPAPGA
jgi:anti-sigma B factor antagonist